MSRRTKVCGHCQTRKPLRTGFYQASKSADGYQSWCKECAKASARKSTRKKQRAEQQIEREAIAEAVAELGPQKTCAKCNETQPLEAFPRNHKAPDGLGYYCRACVAEYGRARYERIRAAKQEATELEPVAPTLKPNDEPTAQPVAEDEPDELTKRCNRCKEHKPLKAFCKDRNQRDGLNKRCRACQAELSRRHYYGATLLRDIVAGKLEPVDATPPTPSAPAAGPVSFGPRGVSWGPLQSLEDQPARRADDTDAYATIIMLGSDLAEARKAIARYEDELAYRDLEIEELKERIAALEAEREAVKAAPADPAPADEDQADPEPPVAPTAPPERNSIDAALPVLEVLDGFKQAGDQLEREAEELEDDGPSWAAEWAAIGRKEIPEKLNEAVIEASKILHKAGSSRDDAIGTIADVTLNVIKSLPGDVPHQARAIKAIARVIVDPLKAGERMAHPYGGHKGAYKVRAGKVRIIYTIAPNKTPMFLEIGYRREVYGGTVHGSN